jgi:hypothetical protein
MKIGFGIDANSRRRERTGLPATATSANTVVHPEQSAALNAVLDKNRVPNNLAVFEGEDHSFDQTKHDEAFAAIKDWFTQQGALNP